MERIHVTVRARPLLPEDAKSSPWRINGNSVVTSNHSFEFDRVFGEGCETAEVYQTRTKEIVAAAVRGFNGTVFAYGQTNSGKTYTMRGSSNEPGVIPLAVHDLFDIIQQDVEREFLLRMSYMEIYNEEINDLLVPEHRKLQIHESLERGIYVAGLREEIVASPQQVLDLMEFGESHRHIGETNMNLHSSRSHTIFRMIIESRDRNENEDGDNCDAVRVSVLNLVDLAGSERAGKTGAEGLRLKEGSHINKSLMTLGTVIKKLSEGAESQGGHVPYRDSKLTRILQPALGGNSNTAIICNITLAQIHADETKSSLQFASRALRVTNCAHVNEILTDAALLKRQKKEIEELRAKLQGSHSEHLEEEILNLRNTLLKSELERERITLELEEEKKAQVERERVLQEQAKKIKNLSSMVLCSNRDESQGYFRKEKRRDTWCPGKLARETLREGHPSVQSKYSAIKATRSERDMGLLLPFEELVNETEVAADSCKQDKEYKEDVSNACILPDPCALLHVTNRRKVPLRKKGSFVEENDIVEMQAEYEDLLLKFETQKTMSDIQIDCLTRKLAENDLSHGIKCDDYTAFNDNKIDSYLGKDISLQESEAIIVIKQLHEKIKILEMEKSSSQQNLNSIVKLAEENNTCAMEKFGELHEELLNAQEEARVAHEQLASNGFFDWEIDSMIKLLKEVQDIISEAQNSKNGVESVSSLLDEVFLCFQALTNAFPDFKLMMSETSMKQKSIISNHEKLYCYMKQRVAELENEKLLLHNQYADMEEEIQELREGAKNHESYLVEVSGQHDLEKTSLLSHIQTLEREIFCLSSCSLAKEKESLRKELEKTKAKLKDTESKLKSAMQEKTKLEGEKAFAEREVKRLQGQKILLERDICKCDSIAGRRRDSVFDTKKAKAFDQTIQDEYRKLEVLAFEMETKIASLEEELVAACSEKEEAISRNENLMAELELMSEKFNISSSELSILQDQVANLKLKLEGSISNHQEMEETIKRLLEEKEELAMQLTNALLEMEEERAISYAREKASIKSMEEKAASYNAEIVSLSAKMSEVRKELESYRKECDDLRERLTFSEEDSKLEKKCSMQKSLEIDRLKNELKMGAESKEMQEMLKSNSEKLSLELHHAQEKVDSLQQELSFIKRERDDLLVRIREMDTGSIFSDEVQDIKNQLLVMSRERDKLMSQIEEWESRASSVEKEWNEASLKRKVQVEELTGRLSSMEAKMHIDEVRNGKEKAKLRMRLRGTQAQLDAYRYRYKEAVDEMDIMHKKFKEASANLKDQLASKALENLDLRKQLATTKGQ
ncbi:hypothetical protein SLE2022_061510 [Rubroshorea leprosula]